MKIKFLAKRKENETKLLLCIKYSECYYLFIEMNLWRKYSVLKEFIINTVHVLEITRGSSDMNRRLVKCNVRID